MKKPIQLRLSVQIIALLIVLAGSTAVAVGLPSIWMAHRQAEAAAWERVEQGSRVVEAGLTVELNSLANLATLTAERPTLLRLLTSGSAAELQTYLVALQKGAGLDQLWICIPGSEPVSSAPDLAADSPPDPCSAPAQGSLTPASGAAGGWMLLSREIRGAQGNSRVVVGRALSPDFLDGLRAQSGLELLLLVDGRFAGMTLAAGPQAVESLAAAPVAPATGASTAALQIDGTPYAVRRQRFAQIEGLDFTVALPTAGIAAAGRSLVRSLAASILVVTLAASAAALILARRLIQPLERLRQAANGLRRGDLTTPVSVPTRVREIAQVAWALEDARSVLQHSLAALSREKEWSEHLLGAIVEGIVTVDRRGRITFFSQGAERISGLPSDRAIGRLLDEVFITADDAAAFSSALPEPGGKRAVVPIRTGGRAVTLSITVARLAPPETGRAGTALVLRDVSDEDALRRLLGDFLANITHEFRTPLSALAASVELMLDQLPTLSRDELRELLDSHRLGTLGLQTLIDNLLEGASIEAGRFQVHARPTDLSEVAAEVVRTIQPLLEKYRQSLVVTLPPDLPPVEIDPRRTAQVLINLLSNAIKWNPEGGLIRLSAEPLKPGKAGEGEIWISVADCGPGIPPEQLSEVFTRFTHRQTAGGRAEIGAGLGLSVVKAIVEAQGGQVGVENPPGGGARFWFTLPVSKNDPVGDQPDPG